MSLINLVKVVISHRLNRDYKFRFPLAVVRTAGLLAVITIAVLSLVSGGLRPNIPIGFQHFVAYLITAVLLSFGYFNWNPVAIVSLMSLYALVLEIAQGFVPGRTPALMDFVEGFIGTVAGIIVARLILSDRARFSAQSGRRAR